jgi:hypothetical protein
VAGWLAGWASCWVIGSRSSFSNRNGPLFIYTLVAVLERTRVFFYPHVSDLVHVRASGERECLLRCVVQVKSAISVRERLSGRFPTLAGIHKFLTAKHDLYSAALVGLAIAPPAPSNVVPHLLASYSSSNSVSGEVTTPAFTAADARQQPTSTPPHSSIGGGGSASDVGNVSLTPSAAAPLTGCEGRSGGGGGVKATSPLLPDKGILGHIKSGFLDYPWIYGWWAPDLLAAGCLGYVIGVTFATRRPVAT